MNILIVGSSGMLGSMAVKFFSQQHSYVVNTFDKRFSTKTAEEFFSTLLKKINNKNIEVVINAVGAIPQRDPSRQDLFLANTVLPIHLACRLPDHIILVTPSTDCIYTGVSKTPYEDLDFFDDFEDYGLSKALTEMAMQIRKKSIIIRGSILGRTSGYSGRGLLDWFLAQPSSEKVCGWVNHKWNGVTTLEWCKVLHEMLSKGISSGLHSVSSKKAVSKYELLSIAKEIWGRENKIEKTQHPTTLNKTLNASWVRTDIKCQLRELKRFLND